MVTPFEDYINSGLKERLPELSIQGTGPMGNERYGTKAPAFIKFEEQKYELLILIMDPHSSTGIVPEGSTLNKPRPVYHPKTSLEWACPLYTKYIHGNVDITGGEIYHRSIFNDISRSDISPVQSFSSFNPFATLKRLVETEETLMDNPKHPEGAHFKIGDPHELLNRFDSRLAVLIHSVKKGKMLDELDKYFIEKTGGVENYLIQDSF